MGMQETSARGSEVKGTPGSGLWGATLGFFIGFAAVSLFGPTAKLLKDIMGLTPTQVGFLVAIPSLSGSLMRIPFGAWVDTTGGRKPFLGLLFLAILGMIGLSALISLYYPDHIQNAHYPLLLVLGAFAGCGIATFSVGIGQVSYWFPQEKQGGALGKYAGLGNIAPGLFAFLLPVTMGAIGLKGAYIVWLSMLILGTIAYAAMGGNAWFFQLWQEGKGKPRNEAVEEAKQYGQSLFPPEGGVGKGLMRTARVLETWLLVALYFVSFGGFLALTAWFPTYWQESHGLIATRAGMLTMLYSVGASLIRVPGGVWSDKLGGERVALGSFLATGVGAILLAATHNFSLCVLGLVLMSMGMGLANAAVFKLVPKFLSRYGGGAGAGWVGGLGAFGGFAIPPVMGVFVQRLGAARGYPGGFSVFVVLSVFSVLVSLLLLKRRK